MKNILFLAAIITLMSFNATAQPGKKPNAQDPAAQAKLNEEMEKAMKNMTPEQREQMKKMMPAIMPAMLENANEYRYPEITNNKELLYKKDMARINAIPKKKLTQADIPAYANNLFSKIMAKGDAAEIAIIKNVMTKGKDAAHFGNAAILCMMQGHAQAAIGLGIKAVQTDPTNTNWQNNMASLLTQYGYAEQAIPVLQKLRNEFDDNSTVLNNLAQAWFSLGEKDSAKYFVSAAIKSNPLNPDAMVCGGVIDEAEGNTESATEKYTQAMAQSPDGFTESVLKNSAGPNGINNIDFDKFLENITVYDYFPKDWIKIPELSNNVSGFENDIAVKNGYAKMFLNFNKDLQFKIDQSGAEIKNSLKQGNEGFAIDMMTAGTKHGTSFISTPARIIVSLIIFKLNKLSQDYAEIKKRMTKDMERKVKEKINAGKNDNCEARDNRNNKFLAEVNHSTRVDFEREIEKYRRWLNAYCTWTWYHTGNMKNFSMVQCLNFTKFYAELLRDAIAMQQTASPNCKEGIRSDGETKPNTPVIPPFRCPTIVSVPAGPDWYALDNTLKNFDANSLGIQKLAGAPVPNMSIAMGVGGNNITEAGLGPFTKTSNGSVLPQYASSKQVTDAETNDFELRKLGKMVRKTTEAKHPQVKISDEEAKAGVDSKGGKMVIKASEKMTESMLVSGCDELMEMKDADRRAKQKERERKAKESAMEDAEVQRLKKELEDYLLDKGFKEAVRELPSHVLKEFVNSVWSSPTLNSGVQAPGTFAPQQNLFK